MLVGSPGMAIHVFPMLLDKLSSEVSSAKEASLKALVAGVRTFGAAGARAHLRAIGQAMFDEVHDWLLSSSSCRLFCFYAGLLFFVSLHVRLFFFFFVHFSCLSSLVFLVSCFLFHLLLFFLSTFLFSYSFLLVFFSPITFF